MIIESIEYRDNGIALSNIEMLFVKTPTRFIWYSKYTKKYPKTKWKLSFLSPNT